MTLTNEQAHEMYEAAMADMINGGPYKTITESTAAIVHSLAKRLAAASIADTAGAKADVQIEEIKALMLEWINVKAGAPARAKWFEIDARLKMLVDARSAASASEGQATDAQPAIAWMVKGTYTELFLDLEEAHKYAMTVRGKVVPLYASAKGASE